MTNEPDNKPESAATSAAASTGDSVSPENKGSEAVGAGRPSPASKKKRRLAKAFPLPLEKVRKSLKEGVREKISLTAGELAWLVETKERFVAQNVPAKKSALVRAGLTLLRNLDDEQLKALLANLPELR